MHSNKVKWHDVSPKVVFWIQSLASAIERRGIKGFPEWPVCDESAVYTQDELHRVGMLICL